MSARDLLVVRGELLCDVVYAADGGDDPDLIADAGAAILPGISLKGGIGNGGECHVLLPVGVLHLSGEVGGHVLGVDPVALRDILCGMADHDAVLYDGFALPNVLQGDLVALRDVLEGERRDAIAGLIGIACFQRMDRNGNVVLYCDVNQI